MENQQEQQQAKKSNEKQQKATKSNKKKKGHRSWENRNWQLEPKQEIKGTKSPNENQA